MCDIFPPNSRRFDNHMQVRRQFLYVPDTNQQLTDKFRNKSNQQVFNKSQNVFAISGEMVIFWGGKKINQTMTNPKT